MGFLRMKIVQFFSLEIRWNWTQSNLRLFILCNFKEMKWNLRPFIERKRRGFAQRNHDYSGNKSESYSMTFFVSVTRPL